MQSQEIFLGIKTKHNRATNQYTINIIPILNITLTLIPLNTIISIELWYLTIPTRKYILLIFQNIVCYCIKEEIPLYT